MISNVLFYQITHNELLENSGDILKTLADQKFNNRHKALILLVIQEDKQKEDALTSMIADIKKLIPENIQFVPYYFKKKIRLNKGGELRDLDQKFTTMMKALQSPDQASYQDWDWRDIENLLQEDDDANISQLQEDIKSRIQGLQ